MNIHLKHCWLSTFALLIILFIFLSAHLWSHYEQQIHLSLTQTIFLVFFVVIPWGVLFLARTKYDFVAWCLLFLSALTSLLFVLINHFILSQADHSWTEAGPQGWFFKITALIIVVIESLRIWFAWKAINIFKQEIGEFNE